MSKQMKKTIFGILGGIVLMLLIAYLPPETEMMSRQGWQYLGCFGFLLTCLISGALPDWVATLATMVMLLVFKLGKVADVTVEFSGTTVWLCIGVFIMSVGINNSGFMKRLALWVLTKFPGTYRGQVTAMMLAGIITTPMIPSSYAKTSIMAPLIGQVCEAVGAEPNSKAARGLWFANFMGTYILGIAFMSGSAFVALMIGFMQGLAFTWGSWLKCTIVWYLVLIVLTYLYCTIICKPKEKLAGDVTFLKEQYKALGAISKKEKQGIIIVAIAIILWITQKLHGVDAGFVAIAADVAFFAAGLLTAPEANAKGQWTLVVFIGGILSIAKFMNTTGVSAWLASLLGPIFAPIMSSPYIFVPCLCIITFALRYVIVSQTCMGYDQARTAIEIGRKLDPDALEYHYSKYYLNDMLECYREKFALDDVIVRYLDQLAGERGYSNSNLLLLYHYLNTERNMSLTAKRVHMHRNSVIYRLQRIQDVLNLDLDDPDVRLRLMITFKILRMEGKLPEITDEPPEPDNGGSDRLTLVE